MPAPKNAFKAALAEGRPQIGLWLNTGEALPAEIAANAGFDWLVIDAEHGPNDLRSIIDQLRVIAPSPAEPVVRPPMGEAWFIKQLLDAGARTLLIPMVDTPEQAKALVDAVRYPPQGTRGLGAAVARASSYNAIPDYAANAGDEICLLVQAETRLAIDNIEAIAAVDGIDGVFIGPADLSADLGFIGRIEAPQVQDVIESAIGRIIAAGKPAGILTFNETLNRRYLELGATFVAVGSDVTELAATLNGLARRYGRGSGDAGKTSGY